MSGISTTHGVQPQVAQFNNTVTQHATTSSSELQGGVVLLSANVNKPVEFNAGTLQNQATETASAQHAVRNSLVNSGNRTTGQSRVENAFSNALTGLPPQRPNRDVPLLPMRKQEDVPTLPLRPQTTAPKLSQDSKSSPRVDLQPKITEKKILNLESQFMGLEGSVKSYQKQGAFFKDLKDLLNTYYDVREVVKGKSGIGVELQESQLKRLFVNLDEFARTYGVDHSTVEELQSQIAENFRDLHGEFNILEKAVSVGPQSETIKADWNKLVEFHAKYQGRVRANDVSGQIIELTNLGVALDRFVTKHNVPKTDALGVKFRVAELTGHAAQKLDSVYDQMIEQHDHNLNPNVPFKYITYSGNVALRLYKQDPIMHRKIVEGEDGATAADVAAYQKMTRAQAAAVRIYSAEDYRYLGAARWENRDALKKGVEHLLTPDDGHTFWDQQKKADLIPLKSFDNKGFDENQLQALEQEGRLHAAMLDSALSVLPPWSGEVYRAMTITKESLLNDYKDGSQVLWDRASSTTKSDDRTTATKFAKDNADENKVAVLFKLQVVSGRNIEPLSDKPKEKEVLLPANTSFVVTERNLHKDVNTGRVCYFITMKEVPSNGQPVKEVHWSETDALKKALDK